MNRKICKVGHVLAVALVVLIAGCGVEPEEVSTAEPEQSETAPESTEAKVDQPAIPSDTDAQGVCDSYVETVDPTVKARVAGAYNSTVGAVLDLVSDEINARAKANGFDPIDAPMVTPDPKMGDDPAAPATLCYVQGTFQTPVPPGVDPPDMSITAVVKGDGYPLLAGYSEENKGMPAIKIRPTEEDR